MQGSISAVWFRFFLSNDCTNLPGAGCVVLTRRGVFDRGWVQQRSLALRRRDLAGTEAADGDGRQNGHPPRQHVPKGEERAR